MLHTYHHSLENLSTELSVETCFKGILPTLSLKEKKTQLFNAFVNPATYKHHLRFKQPTIVFVLSIPTRTKRCNLKAFNGKNGIPVIIHKNY
jgi:hypothetical protein